MAKRSTESLVKAVAGLGMKRFRCNPMALALTALVTIGACSGENRSVLGPSVPPPASVSPPQPEPPRPPVPSEVAGHIAVSSITPESGATVTVRDCGAAASTNRSDPAHSSLNICTDQVRMTLEVLVDQDLPDAYAYVVFMDGDVICGAATTALSSLRAGLRASLETSNVSLSSYENQGEPPALSCQLPVKTTRVRVRLAVRGHPLVDLLTDEYAHSYTFTMQ